MKKLFSLSIVALGFALAIVAFSENATANSNDSISTDDSAIAGGCVGSGACGVTANGTKLIGKWVE